MIRLLTMQATAFPLFISKHPENCKNKNQLVMQQLKQLHEIGLQWWAKKTMLHRAAQA